MTPHDELMALAGKAAGGKWTVEFGNSIMTGVAKRAAGMRSGPNMKTIANADDLDFTEKEVKANAAFIAAACNFVRSDAFRAMVKDAWQPIETAPEGEAVHVYTPDLGDGERFGIDVLVDGAWFEHGEAYDHFIAVGGAGACGPDVVCTGPDREAPYTHWRPLTPPQAIDAAASGAGEG